MASENFLNDDLARQAQDDMRSAFEDLFLKGKADKMPPIDALALFYEFIELTPIGPNGDEMIRRMADRLVAVDLARARRHASQLSGHQAARRRGAGTSRHAPGDDRSDGSQAQGRAGRPARHARGRDCPTTSPISACCWNRARWPR